MHFLPLSRFFGIYVLKLSTLRTLIRAVLSKPVGISTVEYFVALFFGLSALFTCHLTDPARRLNHSTGSIPFYGHAVGTAVEGVIQVSKKPHYFAHL